MLQGESRVASNNLYLGELTVDVPIGPKGKEAIDVVYTYDINSLLEVEVTVLSTKETKKIVIKNENNSLSEEEANKRLEVLQVLKQSRAYTILKKLCDDGELQAISEGKNTKYIKAK